MKGTQSNNRFNPGNASTPLYEAGIGLRAPHYKEIIDTKPDLGWIEVHPENYFGGGIHRHYLSQARELYPLSLHAVGLSLGSDTPVSEDHMHQMKELIDIYEPFQVSDHASWSASGNAHLNDLLPLPYTHETVQKLCDNIDRVQTYFKRSILLENPSSYIAYEMNDMSEAEFMNTIADRTGCGVLLDINNIFVQSQNHNFNPFEYMDTINADHVQEMHLAGHIEREFDGGSILVDTHNQPVCTDVWDLYKYAITKIGPIHTLIEWDADLPDLNVLLDEANKAQDIITASKSENLSDAAE